MKILVVAGGILLAVGLATAVEAQQPGGPGGAAPPGGRGVPGPPPAPMMGPGGQPGRGMGPTGSVEEVGGEAPLVSMILLLRDPLKLTDGQEKKIRNIRADYAKDALRRLAEVRVAEVELGELMAVESPDLTKVEAEVKRIAVMQGELRFRLIQTIQSSLAILSKEQRQQFERQVRQMTMGMMGGGPGPGQHGPGGMMGGGMGRGPMMRPGSPGGPGATPGGGPPGSAPPPPGMSPGGPPPGGGPPAPSGSPPDHRH